MKKGMCVTLDNGQEYNLVDSVTYNDEKFFAAVTDDSDELFFFKENLTDGESLENISEADYPEVIDALIGHIKNTYSE